MVYRSIRQMCFYWLIFPGFSPLPSSFFLLSQFIVAVIVSPCRVQRIWPPILSPLALNSSLRYCLLSIRAHFLPPRFLLLFLDHHPSDKIVFRFHLFLLITKAFSSTFSRTLCLPQRWVGVADVLLKSGFCGVTLLISPEIIICDLWIFQ